ncbi:tRNA (guanosine(46)-N7)-methyltransferase TrmB [Verrucomicrobiales bacterium]|jgi:tRNA (guanine-N7-)-methyltransferase|nr:tRNA (guanosine(46)-N7)-methyltransferase TrmB [Verrucomicrobiales bacterium]
MSNLKRNGKLRWSPSYLRNRGQLTRAQKRAQRDLWPLYGLPYRFDEVIIPAEHFPATSGPLIVEIGFGMGDHFIKLAKALPERSLLGIEVHRPGIAAAMAKAEAAHLENIRVMRGDARLVLTDHFQSQIAEAVLIQFPDPWPDSGDAHRRLVQPGMVDLIHDRLLDNGHLLITTDVEDYANHCRSVLSACKGWNEVESSELSQYRIVTQYEQKGINESRAIHELKFQKTNTST